MMLAMEEPVKAPIMNPRYKREVLRCYDCGLFCADGYEERMEGDRYSGYSETTYHCTGCVERERGR